MTWPGGRLCNNCRLAAMRTRGTCACGHTGVLPGLIDGRPTCRDCSGVRVNIDCRRCGDEVELYRDHLCQRCVLSDLVDAAFADPLSGKITGQLTQVANALKAMDRPNSGLTWIRQKHVAAMLRELVTASPVTHESIDKLAAGRTREYIRSLLVEHGALEPRDELIARFTDWADRAEERLTIAEHRAIVHRYIHWKHLRHMRRLSPIGIGTFLRAKQQTTVAIEYCNWLTERGMTLPDATQNDLDAWIADGATTRLEVAWFLAWTSKAQITDPALNVPRRRRGTAARLPYDDQTNALGRVVHDAEGLSARNRLAAILVLVFAQPIERIVNLRWEDVTQTDEIVLVKFAGMPIHLEHPLSAPVHELAANPGHNRTAAHPDSPWVFRGTMPGAHISATYLRQELRPLFSSLAARLGTLTELSRQTPVAILAEALGYHPTTLERHAAVSGVDYGRYVNDLARPKDESELTAPTISSRTAAQVPVGDAPSQTSNSQRGGNEGHYCDPMETLDREVSARELRDHLSDLLNEVATGERIRVTRNGRPAAVLVSVADLEALEEFETSAELRAYREAHAEGDGSRTTLEDLRRDLV